MWRACTFYYVDSWLTQFIFICCLVGARIHSSLRIGSVFSLHKALLILFEMYIGGKLCESNKREVLKAIVEAEEMVEEMTKPGEDTASQLDDGLSFQEQFQLGRTPGRRQAGPSGGGRGGGGGRR